MTLESIKYNSDNNTLLVLNQLLIPNQFVYEEAKGTKDAYDAISLMKTRGAPAIAMVGVLGVSVQIQHYPEPDKLDEQDKDFRMGFVGNDAVEFASVYHEYVWMELERLRTSRPTAVDLFNAIDGLQEKVVSVWKGLGRGELYAAFKEEAERFISIAVEHCRKIGEHGRDYICENVKNNGDGFRILTHCNTGALATAKYGTALGVIRFLASSNKIDHVYCTETRPYNQGSRLTAYELHYEKIPSTLIIDSAVSYAMQLGKIDCVIVGADRICRNGDTANKIGTYQLSLACQYHRIPFFVAAPSTSIDLKLENGSQIEIEERSGKEISHALFVDNCPRVIGEGIQTWNPGFDVTPGNLISGIITEIGVALPGKNGKYELDSFLKEG